MTDQRLSHHRHALDAQGSAELAVLTRSGLDESRHIGAAAVVGADGSIVRSVGDAGASIYPRSCLKPFQALSVYRSGVVFEGAQAVLSLASHSGSEAHLTVVRSMLDRIGMAENDLLCPADWPSDRAAARAATAPRKLAMNCSGKHAGFLAACSHNGWDASTYDSLDHPLQALTRSTIEEFTGETIDHAGVDGCGAPVFAVTIAGLARGIAGFAGRAGLGGGPVDAGSVAGGSVAGGSVGGGSVDAGAAHLLSAVLADAWALDGAGRANTVTIDELGIFAKLGAEGVMVMGTLEGVGVAVKVLDGNLRAGTLAALTLLVAEGAVDGDAAARVLDLTGERVLGGGEVVGGIRAGAGLAA